MKNIYIAMSLLLGPALALIMMSDGVFAAECASDIKAVTNDDAKVAVEILNYHVKPLTKCELEVEAQAWLLLLKEKVAEISHAEVAAIYKKEEIKKVKKVEAALEDVKEAKEEADREETKEAAQDAKAALKEAKEVEKKIAHDDTLQKAITAAVSKAEEEGKHVAVAGKSK